MWLTGFSIYRYSIYRYSLHCFSIHCFSLHCFSIRCYSIDCFSIRCFPFLQVSFRERKATEASVRAQEQVESIPEELKAPETRLFVVVTLQFASNRSRSRRSALSLQQQRAVSAAASITSGLLARPLEGSRVGKLLISRCCITT